MPLTDNLTDKQIETQLQSIIDRYDSECDTSNLYTPVFLTQNDRDTLAEALKRIQR
jgi:hypothetical protein